MTAVTNCSNTSTDLLQVTVGGCSSAGIRDINQDAFAVKLPSQNNVVTYKGIVACMADGVSCSEHAQQASQTSVTQFIEDYYCTPDSWHVKKSAQRVLSSLNNWLYHHGQQSDLRHNGLVTTFSSIIFKSNTAHLVHAGDSRIYRYRQGKLKQLTQDHCHKQSGRNSFLTRALGMDSHLEMDFQCYDLELNDIFLLSTDGLHEWLPHHDIEKKLAPQQYDLERTGQQLVAQAKNNGSNDNISCLLIKIEQLPHENVDEVHRKLTQLVIPPVMKIGNTIDDFIVQKVIHSRTRSHVYLVQSKNNKQRYILKAPSPHFSEDLIYLEGFIREQWIGRRLHHPNIMKIEDRPTCSPFLYHLCEYIEGQTLRQWIHDNPAPNLNLVRDIAEGLFKAVRAFQRMGMVHRDLKPENIIITGKSKVVLIDFGTVQVDGLDEIASPLLEEAPVGAADYIAPEYLAGERAQHYSDIFSLGVIIYEMLTGKLPYKPYGSHTITHTRHHNFIYQPAQNHRNDLPQWLDHTLKKACHPSPAQRYQAMSEFHQDLSTPNKQMIEKHQQAPLLERNPIFFWKSLSLILLLLMLAETGLLLSC
ncbi:protein kinase [Vibrio sp. Of7-15]|uniref:bifunctional protein-serine/threonine kinase/phosphatase n=1 Tax=Vibrio sp. Of7-15 TaxID=2724879 RepID=UPI001EF1D602|nr:bifunctional protein-serine/threonine kinase/phosphatase [Vibrio sp. Of7-15]MCG7497226.1 protein kinase [Vibrio sp. Of7-15]